MIVTGPPNSCRNHLGLTIISFLVAPYGDTIVAQARPRLTVADASHATVFHGAEEPVVTRVIVRHIAYLAEASLWLGNGIAPRQFARVAVGQSTAILLHARTGTT